MAKEQIPESVKAQVLEEYKDEIKAFIAEQMKGLESAKGEKKQKKANPVNEELVTYTFFKDGGEYSDDVFINVGGEKIVCQRGVPVRIKRKFVLAYEDAMRQNEAAANAVSSNERRFETRTKEVGLY